MSKLKLNNDELFILGCAKIQPGKGGYYMPDKYTSNILNWDNICEILIRSGLAPLVYKNFSSLSTNSDIPDFVYPKLVNTYYRILSRNTILYEHFRKIVTALNSVNIRVIALKGIYLAEFLYKDIGLRQMSDIDLLIHPEDGLKCMSVLSEMGYKTYDKKESEIKEKSRKDIVHYEAVVKDGVSIEIHIKLHHISAKYDMMPEKVWKNAIPATIYNCDVFALNTYDLLIHLCIHLDEHFRGGRVQFTCFSDIVNLLDQLKKQLNWDEFIKSCRDYKCEETVFLYLMLVNRYMNVYVPEVLIKKYQSLLIPKDELLFIKYLNGYDGHTSVPHHLRDFKSLESGIERIRYILDVLFPSKAFMIQKYNISDKRLVINDKQPGVVNNLKTKNYKLVFWWLWYVYRYYIGLKGLFFVLWKRR